jgi:cell division septation protein DedD
VESKPAELPAPIAPVAPIAKPVATTVEIPKRQPITKHKDSTAQPFKRHDASVRAGERYLQIAAFGPRALDGFLKTLEGQGLHPVVAPGPVDNIYRILVGPFPNSTALEETRGLIKASGVEPILRVY